MEILKGKIYECTRQYSPKVFYTFKGLETVDKGSLWEAERVDIYRETVLLRPVDKKSSIKFLNMHFALFSLYFKEAEEKEGKQ
jgi:hypothetical protein